jgi:hypothetical protein
VTVSWLLFEVCATPLPTNGHLELAIAGRPRIILLHEQRAQGADAQGVLVIDETRAWDSVDF